MTFGTRHTDTADVDFELSPLLADIQKSCNRMAEVDAKDTQKVAALLMGMSLQYYKVVQKQAQQSFFSALGAGVLGTGFFIYACWLALHATAADATVSLIAGGLIQVISGINFHLYSKTTRQFAGFHICLERMDRFLLANSYCENLSTNSVKDDCRRKTIEVMVTAPMLTLEQVGISVARPAPAVPKAERAAAGTSGHSD